MFKYAVLAVLLPITVVAQEKEKHIFQTVVGNGVGFHFNYDRVEIEINGTLTDNDQTSNYAFIETDEIATGGIAYSYDSQYNQYLLNTEVKIDLPLNNNATVLTGNITDNLSLQNSYKLRYKISGMYKIGISFESADIYFGLGYSFANYEIDTSVSNGSTVVSNSTHNTLQRIFAGGGIIVKMDDASWVVFNTEFVEYGNLNTSLQINNLTLSTQHTITAYSFSLKFYFHI